MNKITGGSLEFEITANAGKLSDVLEETKRRIQGFSNATAAGGEDMEKAFENALKEQFGKEEAEEMMQQQVRRSLENPLAVIESLLMDSINENLEKEPAEAGAEIY